MRASTAAGINISLPPRDAAARNLPVVLYGKRPLFGVCWISGSAVWGRDLFPWHFWGICRWCYTGRCLFLVFVGFPVVLYWKMPLFHGICGIRHFWHLAFLVPERASCGTEYTRGAQNSLLWYATRIQRLSPYSNNFRRLSSSGFS